LGYFNAVCHLTFLLSPHSTIPFLLSTKYRYIVDRSI
jgi:hypothetical protein